MAHRKSAQTTVDTLAVIRTEERAALIDRWRVAQGRPPPKSLSVSFLRMALSYEAQIAAANGPSTQVLRDLKRQAVPREAIAATSPAPGLKPGDQILRAWNGHTYRVIVTESGFEMAGQAWTSLSALAKHITGAHWSGPRFFGLASTQRAVVPQSPTEVVT